MVKGDGKLREDEKGYGVAPPIPKPCGCHLYACHVLAPELKKGEWLKSHGKSRIIKFSSCNMEIIDECGIGFCGSMHDYICFQA